MKTREFATMAQITRIEARKLYALANNDGRGYSLGGAGDTVYDAATNMPGGLVLRAETTDDVYVVRGDGCLTLIGGDGRGCMPWAVDVTAAELAALRGDDEA